MNLNKEFEQIALMPRAFLDSLGVGISLVDAQTGYIQFVNRECRRILGYAEEELTSGHVTFLDVTHPDDREQNAAEHRRLVAGDISQYWLDKRYLRRDGNVVWAHVIVSPIKDSGGNVRWFCCAVEDITATKIMEQQLAAAQKVSGLVTWNFAVATNKAVASPGYSALVGSSQPIAPTTLEVFIERVHPEDRAAVLSTIKSALARGADYTHEYRIVQDDGSVRWLRGIATCLFNATGEVTNLIGATIDITDTKLRARRDLAPKAIRDILQHIERQLCQRVSIEELATKYGTSSRTIHRYFKSRGISVGTYIRQARLQLARQMLCSPAPRETVTSIALKCGFNNLGHFAKYYQKEFGELPSETLREKI